MSSLKLKLVLVLAFPALLCGSLLGAAEPVPFHLGIDFEGRHAEVLLAPGEPVQLRSQKTGEILTVRAAPEPGAIPKARIEVSLPPATEGVSLDRVELIRIEVTPEGGGPIKSLVEDGQFLRIEEWRTGRSLIFRPDVHSSPAKMRIFEVLRNPDGSERGEQQLLDEADLEIGASSPKLMAKTYLVRILEAFAKSRGTRAPAQE